MWAYHHPLGKYADIAVTLLDQSSAQIGSAHHSLTQQLLALRTSDDAALESLTTKLEHLASPLGEARLEVRVESSCGQVRTETVQLGAGAESAARRLSAAEAELRRLWEEWEDAQREVSAAAREIAADGEGFGKAEPANWVEVEQEFELLEKEMLDEMKMTEEVSDCGSTDRKLEVLTIRTEVFQSDNQGARSLCSKHASSEDGLRLNHRDLPRAEAKNGSKVQGGI
jgi:ribosomal protein S11